ncbi:MAG TPA: hypothetical protein DCZ10_06300 [Pelotomaculum sp.]|nr:hypothetical protein [Pelotomaculum sp.]
MDNNISGGTLAVEPASGAAGDIITVAATADAGKQLVAGSLKYSDGANEIGITATEGVYSFLMPAADVTVTAQFEDIPAVAYTVTVDGSISGGGVAVNPAGGAAGDTITVTVAPDTGKRLVADSLKYTADGGATYTAISETEGVYSFVLPAADVTVTAQFEDEPAGGPVWDGTIDTAWYTGAEPGATSYTISTPAQLAGLAAVVNGTAPGIAQDDFAGRTVTLGDNIRLDSSSTKFTAAYGRFGTVSFAMEATWYEINPGANIWTPIGSGVATDNSTFTTANFFKGTFDGAGYTVSGLYTNIDNTVQGLFGCVGQGGMVKNVTVEGCVSGKFVVGGIAAYLNGGTVQNCVNKAIVYADGGEKADSGLENGPNKIGAVGGIVGSMTGTSAAPATIASCTNYQPVTCTNTNQGGRTGGILGISDKATDYGSISNCVNFGVVDGYQYSGGIAGLIASVNVPITNCGNTALVSGHSSGHCYVGGIVAQTESNIINCYSTGDYRSSIDGNAGDKASNVGGIAGNNGLMGVSHIINCYATGTFVVGGNTVHMSGATVGLICGVTQKMGDLVNCYYLDTAVQPSGSNTNDLTRGYISANDARTEAQMKAAPFLAELNGDGRAFVADTAPNLNSGFPVLRHQLTDTSTITGIVKEADPTTLHYVAGQTFNTAGLLIKANYSDGTSEYITDYTLSIPGELAPTDTAITVSGTYDGMAYSYTFEIVVAANELLSIAITARPITTLYVVGEYFDPTGMVVKATYSNGKIETITEYSFASAPLTKADTAVTISYTYNGVTMTAEQAITVVEGPGLEDDIYILSAPDHLIWFADHVNAGGNVSARAKLTGDIDLSGFTWTPIGTNANKYAGTFDGGGYQITLNIAAGSTANQGLFGYVAGATVKNLTTAGSVATTGSYAAGLVARAEGVTIQNCVNKATVSGNQYVAGLLGNSSANTATVTGSSNEGAINAAGNYSSGLVAYITGGADNSMQNCTNKGTVSGTTNTGGILGYINTVVAIADCVNEGAVGGTQNVGGVAGNATNAGTSLTRSGNTAAITGTSYNVGGILGNSGANASLSECYNTGAVSGTYNVGGILGSSRVLIANCYNTGNVSASAGSSSQGAGGIVGTYTNSSITNCYSTGTVTGTGSGPAGAVVGRLTSGSIVNCYYLEGAAASGVGNGTDETTSKTPGELKSGEFAALLGVAYILQSDAYPILAWQGATAPETYTVTVDGAITGGAVGVHPASAAAGETITVTVTPDSGKRLVAGSLKYNDGAGDIEITATEGVYSFLMPAANVTVTVLFENLATAPKYTVAPVEDEAVYEVGETGGIKIMTVKAGVSGLKYFGTQIAPVVEHEGQEAVVFTHLRDGVQLSLNITKADFDLVDEAQSGFNIQAGDMVKVFIVDDLTNDIGFNPILLQ